MAPENSISSNVRKSEVDGQGNLIIECKEEIMDSSSGISRAIIRADKEQSVENTNMNEKGNRMYVILRITGETFRQGQYINKFLSTLCLVIRQLSEKNTKHVNFRHSKLTMILSPTSLKKTQRTLTFAYQAKGIKNDKIKKKFVESK